jgi:hypothetical protein
MIDSLPLDLFDDDPPESPEAAAAALARCQWCGVEHPAEDVYCPACGATLLRDISTPGDEPVAQSVDPASQHSHCPWCSLPIEPDTEECPACFAMLRGDPNLILPGVNVPLPDSVLWARTLAESESRQGEDVTATIVDLLPVIGEALLKTRGRL